MRRRGSILLETLLAIVLFVAAALFALAALRSALDATHRNALKARAADAARTAIASLEAGLVTDSELIRERNSQRPDGLLVEVTTSVGSVPGLTLVEVSVREDGAGEQLLFELRQLIRIPDRRSTVRRVAGRERRRRRIGGCLCSSALCTIRRCPFTAESQRPQRAEERIHAEKNRPLELRPAERRRNSPPLGSSLGPTSPWYKRTCLGQDAGAEHPKPLAFPSPLRNLCALCASAVNWLNGAVSSGSLNQHQASAKQARVHRRGFTLLELIVAATLILALVAAMAAFLMDALRIRSRVSAETDRFRAADAVISAIEQALETTLVEDPSLGPGVSGDATSLSVLRAGLASWRLGTGDRMRAMEELDRVHVHFDRSVRRVSIGRGELPATALPGSIERLRFRYFDGQAWTDEFDSLSKGQLPVAVEIALWLRPRAAASTPVERPEFDEVDDTEAGDGDPLPDRLRIVTIPDADPDDDVAEFGSLLERVEP
jgi:prepilin-type N-terminal cleavage/methylation domain-containing protein